MFSRIAKNTIATALQRAQQQQQQLQNKIPTINLVANASVATRAALQKEIIPKAIHIVDPGVLSRARKLSSPVGVVAGLFGSLVGVGGGVVIVPSIVSRCKNIPQKLVSGTSLAAVLSTAVASAVTFGSGGCVDVAAAAIIGPFAMMTAPFGARLTTKLNCITLRRILGYFLFCVAPLVPLKAHLLASKEEKEEEEDTTVAEAIAAVEAIRTTTLVSLPTAQPPPPPPPSLPVISLPSFSPNLSSLSSYIEQQYSNILKMGAPSIFLLAATGSVAGLASGLLGIGGGTIVTPLLALVLPPGNQATVLGTSLLSMVLPSSAALAQHARLGNVDWRMAAGLAVGTGIGGALGSSVAVETPSGVLEVIFGVGMLYLGRKTLQTAK
ncbi:hypothetical protein Ndes2526B_g03389 [Nannochloris sp. 'desiccata']|nr:hypothetical protein KSW81_002002 [Chlorella desiccata (nom. nud.)]KAG7673191.1 hypothetical protein KSW81_006405 [Chlorella desiccata (nom. nud.)]KAH7622556.1 hypothetical protein NADE_005141 [Chlorella desiccata (nom. nud.)]